MASEMTRKLGTTIMGMLNQKPITKTVSVIVDYGKFYFEFLILYVKKYA